jgi:hypothetical protein
LSETILHTRKSNRVPNEIIIYDDYAEVILYSHKNIECARTKVSLNKLDIVRRYKWCVYLRDRSCYAMTTVNGNTAKMHNVLFVPPENMICDHRDGNGLNNRDDNVRVCTPLQNSRNVGPKKNNKSGIAGVYWNKANKKWRARIKVNYVSIDLGCYENLEDARQARLDGELEHYGEFSPQRSRQ